MSQDTTNRGMCRVCHHSIRITGAGVLAPHMAPPTMVGLARECPGSGRRPESPPEVPR